MPRFDKTGPNGDGPKTGRGMGICNTDQKNINSKLDNPKDNNQNSKNKYIETNNNIAETDKR